MSGIVLGVAASHSTLMNTHWDEVEHLPEAHEFRAGLHKAAELIADARPDAIVIIGSNHFRGFFLDMMPAIAIGVGECVGAGEAGTPAGPLHVYTAIARDLAFGLVERGFDPAFSLRLTVDHGITHSLQHLVPKLDVPIVPIVINMFAPPLPTLHRIHDLGVAIGEHLRTDGRSARVVVIASGGLSHRLPWPKWFDTLSEDDRFLVDAWLNGRSRWSEYEARRRQIIRTARADINADFDRELLALLETGDTEALRALSRELSAERIDDVAGNGAQEIRSWIAMAASLGPFRATTLAYAPIDAWLTGMGVLVAEPVAASNDHPSHRADADHL
jgi:2,3-dihydroxyphenylpropionate 1,2-dioxygenase